MQVSILRATYRIADFLEWQRSGSLTLSPAFQRRSVWNPNQKSFLLDTVVRGLPIPIVFVRNSIDLETHKSGREMVDGQQRIRTLLAFVDPTCLHDFDAARDAFTLRKVHYPAYAGKTFEQLPAEIRRDILSYEVSTHVLPLDFEDREVLQLFARMNSTGLQLNKQELRNANYAGEFKTWAYELATEQLDRWRRWGIFTEDQISRMKEVETVSDLLMNAELGLSGKSQTRINNFYAANDESWPQSGRIPGRFRHTMDTIDRLAGTRILKSPWSSEVNFFTLFAAIYDLEWGLGSTDKRTKPLARIKTSVGEQIHSLGEQIASGDIPLEVADAMQRASADAGRRATRLRFVRDGITTD